MDGLSMSLPTNRPKSWPLCAGRATGLVYTIYFIIAFELFVIYGSVFVRFRYQEDYFGNIYYGIPLGVVFAYMIAFPINSGKIYGIRLFNFLYKLAFLLFYATLFLTFVLFPFF